MPGLARSYILLLRVVLLVLVYIWYTSLDVTTLLSGFDRITPCE